MTKPVKRTLFGRSNLMRFFVNCLVSFALLLGATSVLAQDTINRTTYYHNTMQGTPVAATNESGDIKWSQTYSTYGFHNGNNQEVEESSLVFGTAGHVEDQFDDRLLVYQQARYYDPALGRFLSIDPVGFQASNPQSFNRYAYVNNNPTTYVDPDGRFLFAANSNRRDLTPEQSLQIAGMSNAALQTGLRSAAILATVAVPGPEDLILGAGAFRGLNTLRKGSKALDDVPNSATARGRASEARVLDDLGLPKNNKKVTSGEGNSIPDALTDRQSIEIKDTICVSCTRQVRIQTDAARAAGRESVLITGTRTRVSGPANRAFDRVIRRDDLGPQ